RCRLPIADNHRCSQAQKEPPGDLQMRRWGTASPEARSASERGSFLSAEQITGDSDGRSHGVGLVRSTVPSVKGLVGSKLHDRQSEWVHLDLAVLYRIAKDIGDAGGPPFALYFGMIRRVRIDL